MKYQKTSSFALGALLYVQSISAVRLDSTLTPCAEQALAQIEAAATQNKHCLCFQYASFTTGALNFIADVDDFDNVDPATTRLVVEAFSAYTTVDSVELKATGDITAGGSLISAIGGECKD